MELPVARGECSNSHGFGYVSNMSNMSEEYLVPLRTTMLELQNAIRKICSWAIFPEWFPPAAARHLALFGSGDDGGSRLDAPLTSGAGLCYKPFCRWQFRVQRRPDVAYTPFVSCVRGLRRESYHLAVVMQRYRRLSWKPHCDDMREPWFAQSPG
jgi:hypothetical protein